jgi:signal transduction histidine kinase
LNNPLNAIYGSIEELEGELEESCLDATKDKLEEIVIQVTRMKGILSDLHKLGRKQSAREVK